MSEEIQISQNQSVDFTDTSSGGFPPLSRLWSFQGGSIASATGATATVFYTNPGQYNVSLSVTDSLNITRTLVETNLINVSASFLTANFTGTPTASILMSTPVNFVDASTGQPQGPTAWAWDIQGDLYTTQSITFTGFDDWFAIGGVPGNAPGEIISVNAQLKASNDVLSDGEVKSFPVTKIGPEEFNYINSTGTPNPNWIIDSQFSFEMNGLAPLTTNDISYPGTDIIYQIDLSGGTQTINKFHTTTENAFLIFTGGILPDDQGICQSLGYLIIDESLYISGQTQIKHGQYISPGLVSSLYFTSGELDTAFNGLYSGKKSPPYSYSQALVEACVNSHYPQTNSGQSPSFGLVFPVNEALATNNHPVVPSPAYYSGLGNYQIKIIIKYFNGFIQNCIVDFDANSGVGNEPGGPSGFYYVMQDVGGLLGAVTQINQAIILSILGGDNTIEAYADPIFNTSTGGGTGDYYGISLEIKDNEIAEIEIIDNSSNLNSKVTPTLPFAKTPGNPALGTCSGMIGYINLSDYTQNFGTRIGYGGSIF